MVSGARAYALQLDLGLVPASVEDVRAEFGSRLDHLAPRLSRAGSALALSLTVEATDLWLAVLLAMTAVTSTGYPVVSLDAQPIERSPDSRPATTHIDGPAHDRGY